MALKQWKKHNFPKSASTPPKSDKHMNQMSNPPFWGCFPGFSGSVLRFGRLKCHFMALENRHFWQKCPFSSAKKWHFGRPNLRTDSKNPAKHPPKWWTRHLIHVFITFGWILSQFLKMAHFSSARSSFPISLDPTTKNLLQMSFDESMTLFFLVGSVLQP